MKVKQTAGRDSLGDFAPKFAQLNDDVLFGEVWSSDGLGLKIRSMLTVTALVSKGLIDSSFMHHLQFAKSNGVTKAEMAEILTHVAFYAGWPNAWAAFRMAKEVYADGDEKDGGMFGLGEPNTAYAQYFVGNSYLKPLTDPKRTVFMANVTFEPKCRNNWHIHHNEKGAGQILLCVSGRGWYQEWGERSESAERRRRRIHSRRRQTLARCGKGQLVFAYRSRMSRLFERMVRAGFRRGVFRFERRVTAAAVIQNGEKIYEKGNGSNFFAEKGRKFRNACRAVCGGCKKCGTSGANRVRAFARVAVLHGVSVLSVSSVVRVKGRNERIIFRIRTCGRARLCNARLLLFGVGTVKDVSRSA